MFTVAIGALALALVKSDDWGWASPPTLGLIAAAAGLVALFIRRSARHPSPVIELHLLRRPVFATATAANVVFGTAFGAMLLLVTLWCQDVWGWSALRTGLGVAPGPLLVPFWSIAAGPLARRIGPGPVAAAGCAIYAAGCVFWRLNLALTPDYAARMLPGMLLTGTGVGLTLPTLVSAAVSAVPPHRFAPARASSRWPARSASCSACRSWSPSSATPPARARCPPSSAPPWCSPRPLAAALVALLLVPAGRAVSVAGLAPAGHPSRPVRRVARRAGRHAVTAARCRQAARPVKAQPAGDPDRPQERHVVADHDQRAPVAGQRLRQLPDRGHVQVVGRLVEQQQLRRRVGEQQRGEHGAEPLAAGQRPRHLVRPRAAEQEPGQPRPDLVDRRARGATARTFSTTVSASSRMSSRCGR